MLNQKKKLFEKLFSDPPLTREIDYLNKYEYSRIIASRALQISNGSEIFIDDTNGSIDPIQIAKLEYEKNKLPFLISRQLPNGSTETFSLKDLKSFEMI